MRLNIVSSIPCCFFKVRPNAVLKRAFKVVDDRDGPLGNVDNLTDRVEELIDDVRYDRVDSVFRNGKLFAGIDLIGSGIVDVKLSVLNFIRNAVRLERLTVLQRDFRVVEGARVHFDRFAQGDIAVVRIDDVLRSRNDDRVVERDRGFDDVEVGGRQEEVVRFAFFAFVNLFVRVDRISEDIVAFFVLLFHKALVDQAVHNIFNGTQRDVFNKHIARRTVVLQCLLTACREVRADNVSVNRSAGHRRAVRELDLNSHDRFTVFFNATGEHFRFRRVVRIVFPQVDDRLKRIGNLRTLINNRKVQIERLVDKERSDRTGLVVDRARNDDRILPVVDDVRTGGSRNKLRKIGFSKKFVRARVDRTAADTFLASEVAGKTGIESRIAHTLVRASGNIVSVITAYDTIGPDLFTFRFKVKRRREIIIDSAINGN